MMKKSGFSLIEILVAITLASIMAVISAPSFSKMRREETFRSEVQSLVNAISEARSNAMSNKMCTKTNGSKIPAEAWSIRIEQSPNFEHQIYCVWDETKLKSLDINFDDNSYTEPKEIVSFSNEFIKDFKFLYDTTTKPAPDKNVTNDGNNVFIHFLIGSTQTMIIKKPYSDTAHERVSNIRIIAESIDERKQAICLNRIQGFPTFNKNGETCAE